LKAINSLKINVMKYILGYNYYIIISNQSRKKALFIGYENPTFQFTDGSTITIDEIEKLGGYIEECSQ
jgi:hypothetical protein